MFKLEDLLKGKKPKQKKVQPGFSVLVSAEEFGIIPGMPIVLRTPENDNKKVDKNA